MGNTTRDAVCWDCRRSAKVSADQPHERRCPECSRAMVNLGKGGWSVPKRGDHKAWAKLRETFMAVRHWGDPKARQAARIGMARH